MLYRWSCRDPRCPSEHPWCVEHRAAVCPCTIAYFSHAAEGIPAALAALPPLHGEAQPSLRLSGTAPGARVTGRITWHGDEWGGTAPVFTTEWYARLSVASEWRQRTEWGIN
jgi:hypothetical protein